MAYSLAYMVTENGTSVWHTVKEAMQLGRDKRSVSASGPKNVVTIRITDHHDTAHYVVRADAREETEKLIGDPTTMVVVDTEPFWEFAQAGVKAHYRTGMVRFVNLLDTVCPAANFLPKPFYEQIVLTRDGLGGQRENITMLYWSHDLSNYAALLWSPTIIDISRYVAEDAFVSILRHDGTKSRWLAFKSMDDAITVKLVFEASKVFNAHG